MKTLITIGVLAALCLSVKAQTLPMDSVSKKVSYGSIIPIQGTKDELYIKAKQWFVKSFKSANYVLQMDDKEAGKLIGKASEIGIIKDSFGISSLGEFKLNYTVYITVKDGKYRYEITDFNSQDIPSKNLWVIKNYDISEIVNDPKSKKSNGNYKKDYLRYIVLTDKIGSDLSASIKETMNASVSNKDNF